MRKKISGFSGLVMVLILVFSSLPVYANETNEEISSTVEMILNSENGDLFEGYDLDDLADILDNGGKDAEKVISHFDDIAIPIEAPEQSTPATKYSVNQYKTTAKHYTVRKNLETGVETTIFEDYSSPSMVKNAKMGNQTEYTPEGTVSGAFSFPRSRAGSWREFEPQNYNDTKSTFKLFMYNGNNVYVGSAFKISGMYLGTAGHCVNNQNDFGGWVDSILCIPATRPAEPYRPLGYSWAASMECGGNWSNGMNADDDWGIIKLSSSVNTGYLGKRCMGDNTGMLGMATRTIGFPGDGGAVQISIGNVKEDGRRRVLSDYPSAGGMSGGPVCDSGKYIIGIHRGRRNGYGDFVKFDNWIYNKMTSYR